MSIAKEVPMMFPSQESTHLFLRVVFKITFGGKVEVRKEDPIGIRCSREKDEGGQRFI
jgi:hypothetical protein